MSSLRLLTHSIITGVGTMSKEKIKRKTIVLYILGTKVFLGYVTLKKSIWKINSVMKSKENPIVCEHTLSPSLRFMPSSSKREDSWTVVSCFSSSLISWEESLDQVMRNPTEVFVGEASKAHLQKSLDPISSTTTSGLPGGGGGNEADSWPDGRKCIICSWAS